MSEADQRLADVLEEVERAIRANDLLVENMFGMIDTQRAFLTRLVGSTLREAVAKAGRERTTSEGEQDPTATERKWENVHLLMYASISDEPGKEQWAHIEESMQEPDDPRPRFAWSVEKLADCGVATKGRESTLELAKAAVEAAINATS